MTTLDSFCNLCRPVANRSIEEAREAFETSELRLARLALAATELVECVEPTAENLRYVWALSKALKDIGVKVKR